MMFSSAIVLLLVGFCVCESIASLKLPPYIKPCSIHDPDLGECEKISGNELIPLWVKGDPAYNIPVLDPMVVNEIRLGDASAYITLTNMVMRGLGNTKIITREHDVTLRRIFTEFTAPLITIDADYDMAADFLGVAIVGRGHNNVTMENWRVQSILDYDLVRKPNGRIHLVAKDAQVDFETTGGQIYLNDVFNGDKAIGARVNQFLNDNYHQAFQIVKPGIGQVCSKLLHDVFFGLTDIVPFDELYNI